MILVVHAHPYPSRSRAGRALLAGLSELPQLEVRSLYDKYPDFDIDIAAEQAALSQAQLLILLHPVYWYSVPSLLKHWFDQVLQPGWAYGTGGDALHGKDCLWAVTTGGDPHSYSGSGVHAHGFADFVAPIEQTARFCGLRWLDPFIVHAAQDLGDAELRACASRLRDRVLAWRDIKGPAAGVAS